MTIDREGDVIMMGGDRILLPSVRKQKKRRQRAPNGKEIEMKDAEVLHFNHPLNLAALWLQHFPGSQTAAILLEDRGIFIRSKQSIECKQRHSMAYNDCKSDVLCSS